MPLTKFTGSVTNVQDLSDRPNASDGLSAAELKAKFDETGSDLKTYVNDTLTAEIDTNVGNNDSHRLGDGSDHADVATNTVHTTGDGSDHADVATNTAKVSFPEAPIDGVKYARKDGAWDSLAGAGTGDVTGPASSTDDDLAQFNGTTGKVIKGGLAVTTSLGSPGVDTNIPTEAAVRAAISAGGAGDFSGPASSTDDNFVMFSGTSGKLGKDSGYSVSGSDSTVITGTAGPDGTVGIFNGDGDLVGDYAMDQAVRTTDDVEFGSVDATTVEADRFLFGATNINAQTGTTYTLVLTDSGKFITTSNTSAVTLTVPPNSSIAFPIGTQIEICNINTGDLTIAEGSGVTVNAADSYTKLTTQYKACTLKKVGTDSWIAIGLEE